LAEIKIPLPPLAEQRRIAGILDKADALRAKRRAALAQLDTLAQSIFLDMFGDPAMNPKAWPPVPLGDLMIEVYRYPTYYEIAYEDDGIPEIRGELLNEDGTIVRERSLLRYISRATSARFPRTVVAEGDLVMTVRGTVGKVGLVPKSLTGANITANLMRLAPDRRRLDPTFAWHCMQTEWFRAQLANACSSTTIATIKAPDLKRITVPLPPVVMQAEFRDWFGRTAALKPRICVSLDQLDALFASLQYRAFRGDL
jgi:type I restriction enzyme S subunit